MPPSASKETGEPEVLEISLHRSQRRGELETRYDILAYLARNGPCLPTPTHFDLSLNWNRLKAELSFLRERGLVKLYVVKIVSEGHTGRQHVIDFPDEVKSGRGALKRGQIIHLNRYNRLPKRSAYGLTDEGREVLKALDFAISKLKDETPTERNSGALRLQGEVPRQDGR